MRNLRVTAFLAGAALVLAAGCNKTTATVDTGPFLTALNTYYQTHPSCAFSQPMTFPVDVTPGSNQSPVEVQRLDALADAGLLTKKSQKVWSSPQGPTHIRVHETATTYDLTDQGKAAWTQQNGGGNFCYATPHVTSVDHESPEPNDQRYGVSYHYDIGSLPSWTDDAKVKAAFPKIAADAATKSLTGLATLTQTANGWTATGVQSITAAPVAQSPSGSSSQ